MWSTEEDTNNHLKSWLWWQVWHIFSPCLWFLYVLDVSYSNVHRYKEQTRISEFLGTLEGLREKFQLKRCYVRFSKNKPVETMYRRLISFKTWASKTDSHHCIEECSKRERVSHMIKNLSSCRKLFWTTGNQQKTPSKALELSKGYMLLETSSSWKGVWSGNKKSKLLLSSPFDPQHFLHILRNYLLVQGRWQDVNMCPSLSAVERNSMKPESRKFLYCCEYAV